MSYVKKYFLLFDQWEIMGIISNNDFSEYNVNDSYNKFRISYKNLTNFLQNQKIYEYNSHAKS